ncbi:tRNA synthetases class I (M)-domain-containing protein [Xylariomycetidae sp. FL2044]|nr:tRNA synthetases class I (M)-domain-containing protein [Xylariomycetidae sp. FL2044]
MRIVWVASARRPSAVKNLLTSQRPWICQTCRKQQAARIRFHSTLDENQLSKKPYYVTTPIFYVNASPHIGHLYSMLIADVLKRWQVLKGTPAILSTGTDEHGIKIQQAAARQDTHPKALCDTNAETFRDLARKANISNDHFIRTTSPEHRDAVEYFWSRLIESGYVYESKHEGWYSVSDEAFYPASMVEKRVAPLTGRGFMASVETGSVVEWTEERNYHFRLTAFKDQLLNLYSNNPAWVVPNNRFNEVIHWVRNNLEDLSISRPFSRMDWGIPVPDDPSQTIYVWVDALINYLTVTGYPMLAPGSEHTRGWPADVHVVGKDIMRFHCVYWPALLMALNLPLPKRVLSHGHWLMSDQKMSKSVGNVVNPFFALERWGVDTMRFYLVYAGGTSNDANYANAFIVQRYNTYLKGGLGNLLNRITRPKLWSVKTAVKLMWPRRAHPFPALVETQRAMIETLANKVDAQMDALHPSAALKEIMEAVSETDRYFHATEPWNLAKAGDTVALNEVIYVASESLRIIGILLQPFMPQKSGLLLDRLGVSAGRRSFEYAVPFADDAYGTSAVELGEGAWTSLFPPLAVED